MIHTANCQPSQHVLVIGPGLGRDDHMQSCARVAFEIARTMDQMSVVVDADGLWLVQNDPSVILDWPGTPRVVLTPNVMEFKRLSETLASPVSYSQAVLTVAENRYERRSEDPLSAACTKASERDDRSKGRHRYHFEWSTVT